MGYPEPDNAILPEAASIWGVAGRKQAVLLLDIKASSRVDFQKGGDNI
jgi:hypothetical protein